MLFFIFYHLCFVFHILPSVFLFFIFYHLHLLRSIVHALADIRIVYPSIEIHKLRSTCRTIVAQKSHLTYDLILVGRPQLHLSINNLNPAYLWWPRKTVDLLQMGLTCSCLGSNDRLIIGCLHDLYDWKFSEIALWHSLPRSDGQDVHNSKQFIVELHVISPF